MAGLASFLYFLSFASPYQQTSSSAENLPSYCRRPTDGHLIVASIRGFNDSIPNGAPETPYPVITVQRGSNVTIDICNIDTQAHGFQITHYYDSKIVSLAPGDAIQVSFVARDAGTFPIYCSIFCSIHVFMQSGRLVVVG